MHRDLMYWTQLNLILPYLFLIHDFLNGFTGHISQVVARFFNLKQIYLVLSF